MPGIAARRQHPRTETGEQRQARAGDGDRPAPGVVEADAGELREDRLEPRADPARDVGRQAAPVAFAAAEEQAMVGRAAEVVDDEAAVGHGRVVGDERARPRLAQRLGRDDHAVDRHDPRLDRRREAGEVAVAGEDRVLGRDRAAAGLEPDTVRARRDALHGRSLEQLRAGPLGGRGEAVRIGERVQVTGAGVVGAAVERRARQHLAERRAVEEHHPVVAVDPLEVAGIGGVAGDQARPVRHVHHARAPIAGDRVPVAQVRDQSLGLLGQREQAARRGEAELPLELVLIAPLPGADLPAVAARGAPADPPGLQENDAAAGLGRVQRCRQAGVAAADDRHVGPHGAGEPRPIGRRRQGGRVPRAQRFVGGRHRHRLAAAAVLPSARTSSISTHGADGNP